MIILHVHSFYLVRGLKLDLALAGSNQKSSSPGQLHVELDDLHMPLPDTNTNNSSSSESSSDLPTLTSLGAPLQSGSNHVTTATPPVIRTGGVATEGRSGVESVRERELETNAVLSAAADFNLMSLNTPETSRRDGGSSAGSSQRPSPTTSPAPTTGGTRGSVGAVGVAVGAGAATLGVATGGGRGSGTNSPAPSTSTSQTTSRSTRVASNPRVAAASVSAPPQTQTRPPQQTTASGSGSFVVRPQPPPSISGEDIPIPQCFPSY